LLYPGNGTFKKRAYPGGILIEGRIGRTLNVPMRMILQEELDTRFTALGRAACVEDWMRRADLLDLTRRPARVLSGGEQRRLAVARALSPEPEVLFLDEPTASLDPASTLAIEDLIQRAHGAGTKVVLVTHDLGQARRFADEIVFLCRGRVEEVSPAASFFGRPRSDKAQAFVDGRIVL
ncbi:MAG: ATP-binding cassette domain-containing protein, partial [Dongiaceae bacterium]